MSQQVSNSTNSIPSVKIADRLFIILDRDLNIRSFNEFTSADVAKHTGFALAEHQSITTYIPAEKRTHARNILKKVLTGCTIPEAPFFLGSETLTADQPVLYSPAFDPEGNITGVSVFNPPAQSVSKKPHLNDPLKKDSMPEEPVQSQE